MIPLLHSFRRLDDSAMPEKERCTVVNKQSVQNEIMKEQDLKAF